MRKRTMTEIKEILEKNTQLELVSTEYVNRKTPMRFKCKRCDKVFETTLASILAGSPKGKYKKYCNECSLECTSKKLTKTDEQFRKEVIDILGNEYIVLGNYENSNTKVNILHKKCGYLWNVVPYVILGQGGRCPKCYNTIKKTTTSFQKEIDNIFDGEFELIGKYKNYHTPIEIKHNKCGRIFKSRPSNFITYKSCPLCSKDGKSKGEERISGILQNMNMSFIREKRFEDCRNERPLPFDFYLPKENVIIEYDGEQHFRPKFNKSSFENIKKTDLIKNEYCKTKNIKLIRIPYTEFDNIENILKASL